MELHTSPKEKYLLEAGLDVLHAQSQEWLTELDFMRDEVTFFYALMIKETQVVVPVGSKRDLDYIENELIALTGGELEQLRKEIQDHERYLFSLVDYRQASPGNLYREKHAILAMKMLGLKRHMRDLKQRIFAVAVQGRRALETSQDRAAS